MSLKIDRVQLEIVIQQDQARQKMIQLEEQMRAANTELRKVKKQFGENSAEYKKQVDVLKKLQQEYDNLYDEIGLANLSLRDLGKRQKDLNAILRQLNPNTELYKQYAEQLKQVNERIKELKGTANETRFSLSKLTDGFNKYGAIAASAIAGLTGITLTMRSCVDEYAKMEEAQSQVIKYTGLSKEAVKELNEEFKQMDTRTPRTRLNELAGDAGKLGISTKEGVKEFVEAADMINVALGEDLGKDAITQIGKLADMFGDGDRSLKENMLAVGSAVNSVAQNSAASEPYLVEFTARMGGVGKQANMAITNIMGYASALDQNMLRSEMASTALSNLILKLYQEPAKYAKLAGLQVEEFTKLMSEDVNEAVLTFLEALNRLGGMDKLAPVLDKMSLSGAEASSVISALAGNVDKVRKEQEGATKAFAEGTSVINEFNVQNSTVQAELDKAKKRFADIRVELGQQLLPVMKYMISTGSLTVKGLSAVVSVLTNYRSVVLAATTALAAYSVTVNATALYTKAYITITKAATVATNLFNKAIKLNPWGLVVAGLTSALSYFAIFRRETDKMTVSVNSLNNINQKTNDEYNRQAARIEQLTDAIKNNNLTNKQRKQSIEELKKIIPGYNAQLNEEGILIGHNSKVIETYLQQLEKQIKLKAAQEELEDLYRQKRKNDIKLRQLNNAAEAKRIELNTAETLASMRSSKMSTSGSQNMSYGLNVNVQKLQSQYRAIQKELSDSRTKAIELTDAISMLNKEIASSDQSTVDKNNTDSSITVFPQNNTDNALKSEIDSLEKAFREEQNLIKRQRQQNVIDEDAYQSQLQSIQLKYLFQKVDLLKKHNQDYSAVESQLLDTLIAEANRKQQQMLDDKKEKLQAEEKTENDSYTKKLLELKESYAASVVSKKEYDKQIEQLEIEHLQRLKNIRIQYGEDISDIDNKIADKGVSNRNENDKNSVSAGFQMIDLAKSEEAALSVLETMYNTGLITYEEYEKAKTRITQDWENRRNDIRSSALKAANQLLQAANSYLSAMQDSEISKIERRYDTEIASAEKAGQDTTALEEQKEQAIWAIKKKYADKQFALNVLDIVANTAAAIMVAWKAGPFIGPVLGAAAALQGAAQLVVAKQQRDEAAGLYSGGYSDDYVQGYTAKGDSRDVAGVIPVHKNEFVTNHKGVANPHVKQFLDVFDVAQRNGTIGMINTTQILQQIRFRGGRYTGGYTDDSVAQQSGGGSGSSSYDISILLRQILNAINKSNEHLVKIAAKELSVNVRSIRDGIKRVEMLERNASR